jgi:hypothetical protein
VQELRSNPSSADDKQTSGGQNAYAVSLRLVDPGGKRGRWLGGLKSIEVHYYWHSVRSTTRREKHTQYSCDRSLPQSSSSGSHSGGSSTLDNLDVLYSLGVLIRASISSGRIKGGKALGGWHD